MSLSLQSVDAGVQSESTTPVISQLQVGKGAKEALQKCLENEAKLTPLRETIKNTPGRNLDGSETPAGTERALVKLQERAGLETGNALLKLTEEYLKKIARPKRKILEEDVYVKEIESIIERDFFPYMDRLRVQTDFADAVDGDDVKKLQSLIAKYGRSCLSSYPSSSDTLHGATGFESPSTFETPLVVPEKRKDAERNPSPPRVGKSSLPDGISGGGSKRSQKESETENELPKKGLNSFMSKVTSEDNVSFEEICTLQNIAQRIKHFWVFKAETEANASLAIQNARNENSDSQLLALKDSAIDTGATKSSMPLDTWPYQAKNMLMFNPDGVDLALQDKVTDAKKTSMQIVHGNTRFAPGFLQQQQQLARLSEHVALTKAMRKGNIGPDGKEIVGEEGSDSASHSFVATPSPMPGQGADASPAMFWGSIENTPARLSEAGSTVLNASQHRANTPIFKIPDIPERDRLGLELAERAAKNHRSKKSRALNEVKSKLAASSKSPNFGSIRSANRSANHSFSSMSPAAQLLLANRMRDRSLHCSGSSPSISVSEALRSSYSPKRHQTPSSPASVTPSKLRKMTPSSDGFSTLAKPSNQKTPLSSNDAKRQIEDSSITDDLLELKNSVNHRKRVSACDFF